MTNELKEEVVRVLTILREDAEMALNGEWDCGTDEGKETGFSAQIELIDNILDKMK
jgi:hypothetical protein